MSATVTRLGTRVLVKSAIGGAEVATEEVGPGRFETTIHHGPLDGDVYRCKGRREALANHFGALLLADQAERGE